MKFSIRFIMGYYASGDTRKTMHSSEDDEGYENRSSHTMLLGRLLSQSGIRGGTVSCWQ